MSFSKDSKQKLTAIAAIVIVALLATNGYLYYNYNKVKTDNAELTAENAEAEQLKLELEKQYYDALSELESMRGKEENLNALIDKQKQELEDQKNRIAGLIRSKSDLKKARAQISEMQSQVENYLAEINTLKEENAMLTEANSQLTQNNQALEETVAAERTMNEELTTAKAALVSEKENLETQNKDLNKVVTFASVVKVRDVSASGWKNKKNGKAKKKKYAKNVEYIKVCFTAEANEVTDTGLEQFFVRVISPIGETLAVEDLGSGITTNTKTGEEIRYTKIKEIEYNNDESVACFMWAPNTSFAKGEYEIEVYNKGYMAGKGTFKLK